MMFGDIGGLNDFIVIIFGTIFGFFSNQLMIKELAETLYHFSNKVKLSKS